MCTYARLDSPVHRKVCSAQEWASQGCAVPGGPHCHWVPGVSSTLSFSGTRALSSVTHSLTLETAALTTLEGRDLYRIFPGPDLPMIIEQKSRCRALKPSPLPLHVISEPGTHCWTGDYGWCSVHKTSAPHESNSYMASASRRVPVHSEANGGRSPP